MTQISFTDTGGGGDCIVFNHGFAMDQSMFAEQVEALRGKCRIVNWDQPGFGQTHADGPFTFWDSARMLWEVLDSRGVDKVVIVGLSQGGFVALRAALLAPARVEGLVLLATQAGTEAPGGPDGPVERWIESGSQVSEDFLAMRLLGPGDWPEWKEKWRSIEPDQLALAYDCLLEREDLSGRLSEITASAVVMHGTADLAVPFDQGQALARGLRGSTRFIPVAGGHHALSITEATAVNDGLALLLDDLAHNRS